MQVGQLSSQVQLQSPPAAQDTVGDPSGAWTVVATVWADIKHLSGLESLKSGADTSVVKASIRIRWRSDVTAAMRVVWGSTTYGINAVLPDAHRRWVDLVCEVIGS